MLLRNQILKIPLILPFHLLPHFLRPSSYGVPSFASSFHVFSAFPLPLVVLSKLTFRQDL